MIHFSDVARESSVQIIINATILLLRRRRQRYPDWKQVSHFLKKFLKKTFSSHILWNQALCYPGAIFHEMELNVSDNQHRLSWQPYSKITNLKKLAVTSWEPVYCRCCINCSDTNRHLKSIIYSALVLHIYIYLHTRLIESSQSSTLQNMSFFQLMFILTFSLVNNLTCNLSVCFSSIRLHLYVFFWHLWSQSTCLCPSSVNNSCLHLHFSPPAKPSQHRIMDSIWEE